MRILILAGRWLAAVLGLSMLCIVLALGFFNPNARRSDIETWVSEQTGRRFTFAGELDWQLWPHLALTLPHTRLEAAGSDSPTGNVVPPFAEWQQASLSIRLWPLLRGRLEFGAMQLSGLRLRLRRDVSGRNNWQDLLQRFTQEPTPRRFQFDSLAGLQVTDAEIILDDAAATRVSTLRIASLRTTALAVDRPLHLVLKAHAASRKSTGVTDQSLDLPFDLSLQAQTDAAQRVQVEDLEWAGQLTAQGWRANAKPIQALPVALRWQHAETQASQQLVVTMLRATIGAAQLSSEHVQLIHLNGSPQVATTLQFAVANLRQWLQTLGVDVPATRDGSVLQNLSAQAQISGGINDLRLQPVTLQLDQTQAGGMAHWQLADGVERYEMDLRADALNLDRYLPVVAAVQKKSQAPAAPLPIEWLRNLQVQGRLHIDAAQWQAIRAQQLTITLDGREMDGA